MATIHQKAVRYARRYPGKTATDIANAIKENPATVSKSLYRAWRKKELSRNIDIICIDYKTSFGHTIRINTTRIGCRYPIRYFSDLDYEFSS